MKRYEKPGQGENGERYGTAIGPIEPTSFREKGWTAGPVDMNVL